MKQPRGYVWSRELLGKDREMGPTWMLEVNRWQTGVDDLRFTRVWRGRVDALLLGEIRLDACHQTLVWSASGAIDTGTFADCSSFASSAH